MSAIREAAEAVILEGITATYDIGFINDEVGEDETEFDADGINELEDLWEQFCEDEQIDPDSVVYVERVEVERWQ